MSNKIYYERLEKNFPEFLNDLNRVVSIPSYY